MNQKEIDDAVKRYNQRLEEHGISEQALGWGEKGRAKLRYKILLSQWDINNSTVLDFGCGFGDLLGYIEQNGLTNVAYTGIDINQNFLTIAKDRYKQAHFLKMDLLNEEMNASYDFIFSSGVFNHALEDNIAFIKKCFEKFNQLSNKGFAVNFLSDKVSLKYDYTYHSNPAQILDLAYKYSNNVVLRNDYMPFEFTVFVNKFSQIDDKYTVYNEFVKYI